MCNLRNYAILFTLMLAFACNDSSDKSSQLHYQIYNEKSALITIPGLLAYHKYSRSPNKLNICIIPEQKTMPNPYLLLEVKLAYATWMDAAGYSQEDFERLHFFLSKNCSEAGTNLTTVISVGNSFNNPYIPDPYASFTKTFIACDYYMEDGELKPRCAASQDSQNFQETGIITGKSPVGSKEIIVTQDGKKLVLNVQSAGYIILNPYVKFQAINSAMSVNGSLTDQEMQMIAIYQALTDSSKQSYSNLLYLTRMFKQFSYNANDLATLEARKLWREFSKSAASFKSYEGRNFSDFYSIILHEVGHQFGLVHMLDLNTSDKFYLTGDFTGTQVLVQDQLVMGAVMDINNVFKLYLTDDDVNGVKAVKKIVDDIYKRYQY